MDEKSKKSLDNAVKQFQGFIFAELQKSGELDEVKIAGYVQSIRVLNEEFDSNYTTNLERFKAESKKPDYRNRLPLSG